MQYGLYLYIYPLVGFYIQRTLLVGLYIERTLLGSMYIDTIHECMLIHFNSSTPLFPLEYQIPPHALKTLNC